MARWHYLLPCNDAHVAHGCVFRATRGVMKAVHRERSRARPPPGY